MYRVAVVKRWALSSKLWTLEGSLEGMEGGCSGRGSPNPLSPFPKDALVSGEGCTV